MTYGLEQMDTHKSFTITRYGDQSIVADFEPRDKGVVMMEKVYVVWYDLGEVYEGNNLELRKVCSNRLRAQEYMKKLIVKDVDESPHWHPSYTRQEKLDIVQKRYLITEELLY